MEFQEYWRSAGRRRWILILLPAVAAFVMIPLAMREPPRYTVTATVTVQPSESAPTPPSVNQVFADFQALLESDPLLDRVGKITGVESQVLERELSVNQIGNGSLARISYTGIEPAEVKEVVSVAAATAYDMLYTGRIKVAEEQAASARERYQEAVARKQSIVDQSGTSSLQQEQDLKGRELLELRVMRARAQLDGEIGQAERLDKLISPLQETLHQLNAQMALFDLASEEERRASSLIEQAEHHLTALEGLRRFGTRGAVDISSVRALPRLPDQVEKIGRGVLVSMLLAGGILLASELLRPKASPERALAGETRLTYSDPP